MRFPTELIQLPLRFDAARLAAEVEAIPESDWRPHPQGHPGNSALPLLAADGDPANDAAKGPMRPTPQLAALPYLRQVLATLEAPIGRTRLMRLDGNAEATAHADVHYYWVERMRVHVPIVTTPRVEFLVGERTVNMAPGECWVFDTWRVHNVINPEPTRRIHLVADTVGSPEIRRLIEHGAWPFADPPRPGGPPRMVPFRAGFEPELALESSNQPVVMSPWEQQRLAAGLLGDLAASGADAHQLAARIEDLQERWRALWAQHGDRASGWEAYRAVLDAFDRSLAPLVGKLKLPNRLDGAETARHWLVRPALSPDLAEAGATAPASAPKAMAADGAAASADLARRSARPRASAPVRFERPIFIVSPPRSGSSLLFETLAQSPTVWTIGGESHGQIERIPGLHPEAHGWESNRLGAADLRPHVLERLVDAWFLPLRNRDGARPAAGAEGLRLLEKTPKNSLRVPFLAAAFPDALFVYLYRHPREAIASMHEAWRSGRFVTYPELPGWTGPAWSMLLTPGWRELAGRPLPEIAALQWAAATDQLLADLEALPAERWCIANYGRLVSEPQIEVERLCRFLGIGWDRVLTAPLPPSRHTLTPPEPGKWRRQEELLAPAFPLAAAAGERALALFARRPEHLPLPETEADAGASSPPEVEHARPAEQAPPVSAAPELPRAAANAAPLRSVATRSFGDLLRELGSSLLVSTYQSGRVVVVRADETGLNTHFRMLPSPMGIALGRSSLAIGTAQQIVEYRNVPAAAPRVPPAGKHDSCFVPRAVHVTGDVRVHELAFAGDELWMVNTRFSCLATLDREHSFVPRWRPPFVTALAPEDRCHLNGLAVRDGKVEWVTALGTTDTAAGWRAHKADGGVLMTAPSGEVVAAGLSMPHSPRWHGGRLWVLESGKGEIGVVDPVAGRVATVARLPGFTRGLAFAGPYAFVGLSQVRESVFGGIPLAERLRERVCGVWVVDVRSGETVAFLRFEDAVQEIFAVTLLPGLRYPELAEDGELSASTWVLPQHALADVPAEIAPGV